MTDNIPRPEPVDIQFLTVERADLVHAVTMLISAIPDEFLRKPERPLLISVTGEIKAGKKLVMDAGRGSIAEFNPVMRAGILDNDEYWVDENYPGGPIEIDFINVALMTDYGVPELNAPLNTILPNPGYTTVVKQEILDIFLRQRRHGGISFIQNCTVFSHQPDIQIQLEAGATKMAVNVASLLHQEPVYERALENLTEQFNSKWIRYVAISIHNQDLLRSSPFMDVLNTLVPPATQNGRHVHIVRAPARAAEGPGCERSHRRIGNLDI